MFAFKSSREREKLPFVVSGDSLWITLHPDERTVPTAKDVDAGSELQQRWLNQAITNFSAAQRVSDCGLAAGQTIFAKNFLRAHKVSSPRWRRDGAVVEVVIRGRRIYTHLYCPNWLGLA